MNFKKLGNTDLKVSTICLGTMTWGEQNNQNDAFEQMDYALDKGINFFDTADVYGDGRSEKFVGELIKSTSEKIFILVPNTLNVVV